MTHSTADRNAEALARERTRVRSFWRSQIRSARARDAANRPPGYPADPADPRLPSPLARLVVIIEGPRGEALPREGQIHASETLDRARQREAREAAAQLHDALDADTRRDEGPAHWRGWRVAVYDGADCILRAPLPELLQQSDA